MGERGVGDRMDSEGWNEGGEGCGKRGVGGWGRGGDGTGWTLRGGVRGEREGGKRGMGGGGRGGDGTGWTLRGGLRGRGRERECVLILLCIDSMELCDNDVSQVTLMKS